jgi:hypothetical protein
MKSKGFFQRLTEYEDVIEQMVSGTVRSAEPIYVLYHVRMHVEVEPAGGDGWNEPRHEAQVAVHPEVRCVEVHFIKEDKECIACYARWTIGPVEPGIKPPGEFLELTDEELKPYEETAFEKAWCEPDPDQAFESKYDR